MGPTKTTEEKDECCICTEDKEMIELPCKHRVCSECWLKTTQARQIENQVCPLCRSPCSWKCASKK
ncbi:MAG: hypothetical protein Sylvanvirus35_7 [Sylvanvirus sp.]|uniref:RING-type domain-containing protein n=1 Tax=Sylvanvirus sp. TaxID=2487774 RepID=A0A3G5AMF8_9VIRU|nr:MAG: hypothetical protein Sylvanvirus35_7 [Sylvanvirus sp.]